MKNKIRGSIFLILASLLIGIASVLLVVIVCHVPWLVAAFALAPMILNYALLFLVLHLTAD